MPRILTITQNKAVTVADFKHRARIDGHADDKIIDDLIAVSTATIAKMINSSITETLVEQAESRWCKCFNLYPTKIKEITSVEYYDTDDVIQTLAPADYRIQKYDLVPKIEISNFPTIGDKRKYPIIIKYISGWPSVDIPAQIKQAIYTNAANMYEHRDLYNVGFADSLMGLVDEFYVPIL